MLYNGVEELCSASALFPIFIGAVDYSFDSLVEKSFEALYYYFVVCYTSQASDIHFPTLMEHRNC